MCYPKPGPRCSAHVAKDLIRARNKYDRTLKLVDHEKYRDKVREYMETPTGIRIMKAAYGEDSVHVLSLKAKRQKMLNDFHEAHPDYGEERAKKKFDKRNEAREHKVAPNVRMRLLNDRFISDSIKQQTYFARENTYEDLCSNKLKNSEDVQRSILYTNDNYVICNVVEKRDPESYSSGGYSDGEAKQNAELYEFMTRENRNTYAEMWDRYKNGHRKFKGTQNERSIIAVKGYIPAKEMSVEEYEIQQKMSDNIGIIKSLQKKKESIENEDEKGERKAIVAKIEEKMEEGYYSLDLLSTQLREHSERNQTLNYLDSLGNDEKMNDEDMKIFDGISQKHFQY